MKTLYHIMLYSLLVMSTIVVSCNDKKTVQTVSEKKVEEVYTCPMHPEIIRNAPGSCPICGMDLVKKETGSAAITDVEFDALLKPANAFVVSSVPVTTIEERAEDITMNVTGTVTYDTRQAGSVSSRVSGRIERLYIRYKYQSVQKGQRIMDIYSPELMTAQQNLLFLLKNDPNNNSLIGAARDRLLLSGMSPSQVAQLVKTRTPKYSVAVFSNYSGFVTELINSSAQAPGNMQPAATNNELAIKEGMYVKAGQAVFSIYNQNHALILLDVFPEQQSLIRTGNAVRIVPETKPQNSFRARISYIEPVFRPGTKTLSARVYFNNASLQLPVGSRVTANIFARPQKAWWLPKESVLSLGRDKIVFKKQGGGFKAHKITSGSEVNKYIHILTGLQKEDSVAVNAQFLVDNEAFIKVNAQ